jgi:L-asparaginase
MLNKEVCLIYTGGTIGMQKVDYEDTLKPPERPEDFCKIVPEIDGRFDFHTSMNLDSTNVTPKHWKIIANEIYERRNDGYKGFVVAHGTDTMHFTASAVAFALGKNLNFPVVFTGAQTYPGILHGDARVNLLRAFEVATTTDIAEVVICFGDYVFRACRAQKKDERRFDAYESPAFFPLAYITEEILPSGVHIKKIEERPDIELKDEFSQGVFQVSLIPGLEPSLVHPMLCNDQLQGNYSSVIWCRKCP